MKAGGYSKIVSMLLTCLVILFVAGVFLVLAGKSTSVTNKKVIPTEEMKTDETPSADPVVANWKRFSDTSSGIEFSYPSYVRVESDSKSSKANLGPTARSFYVLSFNPNPNTDFDTFSAFVEIAGANNFVLNIGSRFVSFDASNDTWYVNTDANDRPTPSNPRYKNLFKEGNQFSPNLFSKTTSGLPIYGVFNLGDSTRGTDSYLVHVVERDIIVHVGVQFNTMAIDGSTLAIQALKKMFDKDLPHILRSVSSI